MFDILAHWWFRICSDTQFCICVGWLHHGILADAIIKWLLFLKYYFELGLWCFLASSLAVWNILQTHLSFCYCLLDYTPVLRVSWLTTSPSDSYKSITVASVSQMCVYVTVCSFPIKGSEPKWCGWSYPLEHKWPKVFLCHLSLLGKLYYTTGSFSFPL